MKYVPCAVPKQKYKFDLFLLLKINHMKQQHDVPHLEFDQNLLREINDQCLPSDEKITIEYSEHTYTQGDNPSDEEIFFIYLKKNNHVVSQIELMFTEDDYSELHDAMIISSETKPQYIQRHYNTILRCVLVLLLPRMKIEGCKIKQVVSNAQNYLSVYSLAKLGFVAEQFELQQFDLSFYSPYQQKTQQQRVQKQKQLKQYIKQKYQKHPDNAEVSMVLLKKDFRKSSTLAKSILNRVCGDCLTRKRKHSQQK